MAEKQVKGYSNATYLQNRDGTYRDLDKPQLSLLQ